MRVPVSVTRRPSFRAWWFNRRFGTKVCFVVPGALVVLALLVNFGPTRVLIGVLVTLAVGLAFRQWKWPVPGKGGWIAPIALVATALVALLSYTGLNPLNHAAASSGRLVVVPAPSPAVPSNSSGDQVSKIVINGSSYSVTGGRLETIPLVAVTKDAPHMATVPVQVFVADGSGKPVNGVKVSVNGQSGTTGPDGSYTFQEVVFENKEPAISGQSNLKLTVGDSEPASIEVWALNILDGSIGQPALTKQQAIEMLSNPRFVASLTTMCPGITPSDIVGLEQVRSTGQGMIFLGKDGQLANSSDQIPVWQPVWSFELAAGKSCDGQPSGGIVVNPVCQNVGGRMPGSFPILTPATPSPTPSQTQTPQPTPSLTPIPTPSPTKNPGNAPPPPTAPPSNAPSPPLTTPSPGSGQGVVTVQSHSCDGSGSCSVGWTDSNTATNSGWVTCNGAIHWGVGSGGSFSDSFKLSPGVSYPCRANSKVGGSSTTDSSPIFYLSP